MTIFNDFTEAYDLMFPWPERLREEGDFWAELFARHGVRSVLDCACGTGMHLIRFAELGLAAYGSDLSPGMVETAMANAVRAGVFANVRVASFTELTRRFDVDERFDAVICVGNSLTLAPADADVALAVREMRAMLNPGGICVLNIFNWDKLAREGLRIMPAARASRDGREVTFLRVFHYKGEVIDLHIVVMTGTGGVETQVLTALQRPVGFDQLTRFVKEAGFTGWEAYNGYDLTPFDPETSDKLILVAITT
jgi:SAM-dependent methyltransferase